MQSLFAAVVRHPVAVTMVFLAALVFGGVSYQRLPIELMPDIAYPMVTVRTAYEGAAPQEVEAQISRPIEESLATIDDAMADIESALADDPNSDLLQRMLANHQRMRLGVLQRAAAAVQAQT